MSAFLNPLTRERGDHMIAAAACVAATLLALVYNVIHALPLFCGKSELQIAEFRFQIEFQN